MSPRVRSGLITAALAAFAVVVGCHDLGKPSLWFDEAFSVDMATRPFDSFVSLAANREANQSLYYLVLRIWPFRDSEFGVRLLSVLFTGLAVAVLYHLGRRLYDNATGIIAAVLLAVLPFALQATQEARGYSLLMLAATASTYALIRAVDGDPRWGWWIVYGICIGAMAYTHFYGMFLVLAHLMWAVIAVGVRRGLLVALAVGGLLSAPMIAFYLQRGTKASGFLKTPERDMVEQAFEDFGAGRAVAGIALLALAAAGLIIGLIRSPRSTSLLAAWVAVTMIPVVFSIVVAPIFQLRYLAGQTPALALLMAVAICAIPDRGAKVVVAAAVTTVVLALMSGHFGPLIREDWRGAVGFVTSQLEPGDELRANPFYLAPAVNFYRPGFPPLAVDRAPDGDPTAERLWVIGRRIELDVPGYRAIRTKDIGRVRVTLYERSN